MRLLCVSLRVFAEQAGVPQCIYSNSKTESLHEHVTTFTLFRLCLFLLIIGPQSSHRTRPAPLTPGVRGCTPNPTTHDRRHVSCLGLQRWRTSLGLQDDEGDIVAGYVDLQLSK